MDVSFFLCISTVSLLFNVPGISTSATVKLIGGNGAYGAVQVTYNGQTGMVCDDFFTETPSTLYRGPSVVCRMLGFPGVENVYKANERNGQKFFPSTSIPILLDDVQCAGNERNIADCPHGQWGHHDCGDSEVSAISCRYPSSINQVSVKLVQGNEFSGALYLTSGAFEGYLCADDWDTGSAEVVCNMLGFDGVLKTKTRDMYVKPNASQILIGGVKCQGNESQLLECSPTAFEFLTQKRVGLPQYCCENSEVAGVECNIMKNVSLVGGNTHAGAVQITYHNGSTGFVCDDDWDLHDANVVCKMLGFPGAVGIPDGNTFINQSNTSFQLSKVACKGDENSIQECQFISGQSCSPSEIAGVNCCSLLDTVAATDASQTYTSRYELTVNVSQNDVIQGESKNLTLTCDAKNFITNISTVTFMQITKVIDNGSVSPIVAFTTGTPKPIFVDSSFSEHAFTSGSLSRNHGIFLSLLIPKPVKEDSGRYQCTISYVDENNDVKVKKRDTDLKVWELTTIIKEKKKVSLSLKECERFCDLLPLHAHSTTTTAVPSTSTPQNLYLDLTIHPTDEVIGQTKNLTVTCDARNHSSSLLVAALLQMYKEQDDGTLTTLVELLPGSQRPVFVDSSLVNRAHVAGTLEVGQGVYLQLVIPNPLAADAGRYRCKMSYLGPAHLLEITEAEATLAAFDLSAMVSEVHALRTDLQRCRAACLCHAL